MPRSSPVSLPAIVFFLLFSLAGKASGQHSDAQFAGSLQQRASGGDAFAQLDLGVSYQLGSGVRKNFGQAALWYRKAANQGNARAQFRLAGLYWEGEGVEEDRTQACYWYRKAAEQGDV
jgi:TPR repeat protein